MAGWGSLADLEGRERNRGRKPLSFRAEAKLERRISCDGRKAAHVRKDARTGGMGGEKAGGIIKVGRCGHLTCARGQGRGQAVVKKFLALLGMTGEGADGGGSVWQ